ncbi:MAG TPA: hypothetical protein VGG62_10615 [Terracidiphilus sp.]|jgi:hypothetical protein
MKMRLAIRGFAGYLKKFEDRVEIDSDEIENLIPSLAEKHGQALAAHRLHMIEIEFLDELDPIDRFFRIGTNPSRMVVPIEFDLTKKKVS